MIHVKLRPQKKMLPVVENTNAEGSQMVVVLLNSTEFSYIY